MQIPYEEELCCACGCGMGDPGTRFFASIKSSAAHVEFFKEAWFLK